MVSRENSESIYDWEYLHGWLLWYIGVFLRFAEVGGDEWLESETERRPLVWAEVMKITDANVRNTVGTITAQISEAIATRNALPGDFADTVTLVQKEERLLQQGATPESIWNGIQEFEH